MKLTIKLDEISYGDVAVKAMPFLRQAAQKQNNAVGKTIAAISQLPYDLIYSIFDAIPMERKNEIVAAFVMENKEKILAAINKMSKDYKIGVTLSNYAMNQELGLSAIVSEIDYQTIAERFLPEIREKLLNMGGMVAFLRPVIEKASAEQVCELLDKILGKNKESLIASLINKNQQKLISLIEDAAKKQNIDLKINSIIVEA